MKYFTVLALTGASLLLAGPATTVVAQSGQLANAEIKDAKGKAVGTADFVQTPAGVLIKLTVKDLPAGEHAVHIHTVGKCEPPFESAGAHFNPSNHKHGMMAGAGHAGDMPNLHVPHGGEFMVELLNAAVTLENGKPSSLLDNDGSTLVIHASADDYRSDPAGNAGDRIACGVIVESGSTVGRPSGK
jgi:Cu-Zn family superoxide dismutase